MATAKQPAAKKAVKKSEAKKTAVTKTTAKKASAKAPAKKSAARKSPEDKYTDPELREHIKEEILEGDKGGRPGQWSARKAQMVAHEYEAEGGGYKGERDETPQSLTHWGPPATASPPSAPMACTATCRKRHGSISRPSKEKPRTRKSWKATTKASSLWPTRLPR